MQGLSVPVLYCAVAAAELSQAQTLDGGVSSAMLALLSACCLLESPHGHSVPHGRCWRPQGQVTAVLPLSTAPCSQELFNQAEGSFAPNNTLPQALTRQAVTRILPAVVSGVAAVRLWRLCACSRPT